MQKLTKLFFRKVDAAAAVKHHVAVDMGPQGKGDFPDVVPFQAPILHFQKEHVRNGIQSGRLACPEIPWKLSRALSDASEYKIKYAGLLESVINITLHHRNQPLFQIAAYWVSLHVREKFFKFAVGNGVQERYAVGEVVIDGHWGDAHGLSNAPHADRFRTFLLEDGQSHAGDAICGVMRAHLYSV